MSGREMVEGTMVEVKLEGVSKFFGDVKAVDDVSFQVTEGEIITLLGPSGCGKSTTLRAIAGFARPDKGKIFFGDKDVTNAPPQDRQTGMVFQNYALWPHLSVKKNVEYGLTVRKFPSEERTKKVIEALKLVKMESLVDRMPSKLSGGQQQRIALARALVVNPDVLLLDEPLSNLDARLRVEMRQEIRLLVKNLGLTAIFVTHDQSEALSISDRVAVMDIGRLRQVGTPHEIWENPANAFVGTFIGEANLLEAEVGAVKDKEAFLNVNGNSLKTVFFKGLEKGEIAKVVVRPDRISVSKKADQTKNQLPVKILSVMYLGTYERVVASIGKNITVVVHRQDQQIPLKENEEAFIEINPKDVFSYGSDFF